MNAAQQNGNIRQWRISNEFCLRNILGRQMVRTRNNVENFAWVKTILFACHRWQTTFFRQWMIHLDIFHLQSSNSNYQCGKQKHSNRISNRMKWNEARSKSKTINNLLDEEQKQPRKTSWWNIYWDVFNREQQRSGQCLLSCQQQSLLTLIYTEKRKNLELKYLFHQGQSFLPRQASISLGAFTYTVRISLSNRLVNWIL